MCQGLGHVMSELIGGVVIHGIGRREEELEKLGIGQLVVGGRCVAKVRHQLSSVGRVLGTCVLLVFQEKLLKPLDVHADEPVAVFVEERLEKFRNLKQ